MSHLVVVGAMRQVRRVSLATWPMPHLPAAAADDISLSSRPYRLMYLLTEQAADAAPTVVSCMRADALAPPLDVPYHGRRDHEPRDEGVAGPLYASGTGCVRASDLDNGGRVCLWPAGM